MHSSHHRQPQANHRLPPRLRPAVNKLGQRVETKSQNTGGAEHGAIGSLDEEKTVVRFGVLVEVPATHGVVWVDGVAVHVAVAGGTVVDVDFGDVAVVDVVCFFVGSLDVVVWG